MLTYEDASQYSQRVLRDGTLVGHIQQVYFHERKEIRYAYYPLGQNKGGIPFDTLDNCKMSLEG